MSSYADYVRAFFNNESLSSHLAGRAAHVSLDQFLLRLETDPDFIDSYLAHKARTPELKNVPLMGQREWWCQDKTLRAVLDKLRVSCAPEVTHSVVQVPVSARVQPERSEVLLTTLRRLGDLMLPAYAKTNQLPEAPAAFTELLQALKSPDTHQAALGAIVKLLDKLEPRTSLEKHLLGLAKQRASTP